MAMSGTIVFGSNQEKYPYYLNLPPNVPKYPCSQTMFRRELPEKHTSKNLKVSHQNWNDKWYSADVLATRHGQYRGLSERRELCPTPLRFDTGMSGIKTWNKAGKDWPVSEAYLVKRKPGMEITLARANHRICNHSDEKLYPFSNWMTAQYRPRNYPYHGSLKREDVYGLTYQHNRHGNMTFEEYY